MNLTNSLRGIAPSTRSATSPFLNRMKVGIEVTMYFIATWEDSSTLILATLILSLYWVARSSTIGATERQGPHQGAQKSTSTGTLLFRMSPSKLASDTWETFSLDIKKLLRPQSTRRSPEGIQAPETRAFYPKRDRPLTPALFPRGIGIFCRDLVDVRVHTPPHVGES